MTTRSPPKDASLPQFSSDGRRLYFLMANGHTRDRELWSEDLVSGKMEQVLKGYSMESYSISRDGKKVAFAMKDPSGRSSLWIAPISRRSSPVHLSSAAVEDSPFFCRMVIWFSARSRAARTFSIE